MSQFQFQALGTAWTLMVDDGQVALPNRLTDRVLEATRTFDQRYSRFIATSEVMQFRDAPAGDYPISAELTQLLVVADQLRKLTAGAYDPAVGGLLAAAGYDEHYRFTLDEKGVGSWHLPTWQLHPEHQQITIDGPIIFDIGGMGKGYWIDQLSNLLYTEGYPYHLVDGGGDIYATEHRDGEAWCIALEWPGRPGWAIGQMLLHHQGFAASDTYRRRWGEWHHLIDIDQKKPTSITLAAMAVAATAWVADQMTAALTLVQNPADQVKIANQFGGEYLVVTAPEHQRLRVSPHWPGTFFEPTPA